MSRRPSATELLRLAEARGAKTLGINLPATPAKATVGRVESRMNKGETAFSRHLEALRAAGEVLRWDYEPESLRLAEGTHYRPDFRVVRPDGAVEFYDVKGRKGASFYAEEDAWIKIKVAAYLHPYRFFVVWPAKGGGWEVKRV